jgi:hypothetical protein
MFHAVERGKRAFGRSGRVDVGRNHKQRHRLFVRLGDRSDDIGRAAARRDQADRRPFGDARVAQRHVAGAAFMLGVDELYLRPFGDGIAQRKQSVGQNAEYMAHVVRY